MKLVALQTDFGKRKNVKRKAALFLLAIALTLMLFGCTGPIQKPAPQGTNCTQNQTCFGENFLSCSKAYGNLDLDANNEFYLQIIGQKGQKCEIYVQLVKAKDVPEFAKGLDAICNVDVNELVASQGNIDIKNQDCKGPLYDAYSAITSMQ